LLIGELSTFKQWRNDDSKSPYNNNLSNFYCSGYKRSWLNQFLKRSYRVCPKRFFINHLKTNSKLRPSLLLNAEFYARKKSFQWLKSITKNETNHGFEIWHLYTMPWTISAPAIPQIKRNIKKGITVITSVLFRLNDDVWNFVPAVTTEKNYHQITLRRKYYFNFEISDKRTDGIASTMLWFYDNFTDCFSEISFISRWQRKTWHLQEIFLNVVWFHEKLWKYQKN